jgi:Ricin-type beta-trefoil lectin domain-like
MNASTGAYTESITRIDLHPTLDVAVLWLQSSQAYALGQLNVDPSVPVKGSVLTCVWYLSWLHNAYDTIVSAQSGKCVDVPNNSMMASQPLQQYTCHGGSNQSWEFSMWPNTGQSEIRVQSSGLCLGVDGSGHAIQTGCSNIPSERWSRWSNPSPSHP